MRRAAAAVLCVVGMGLWVGQGALAAEEVRSAAPGVVFDVPQVAGITIDGKADDWGDRGLRINVLADVEGRMRPRRDLDATCRLAWDSRGLIVVVDVNDDLAREADTQDYWNGDAVELYFSRPGAEKDMYQVTAAPGVDAKHAELRVRVMDMRLKKDVEIKPLVSRSVKASGGYTMEVLLPLDAFGQPAGTGQEYQLQVQVNDWDAGSSGFRNVWFPSGNSWSDPAMAHRIRLADAPSAPSEAVAFAGWQGLRRLQVLVVTSPQLVGKSLELRSGDRTLATATVVEHLERGQAILRAPLPPRGEPYGTVKVMYDGRVVATAPVDDIDVRRRDEALRAELRAEPFVMSSGQLPAIGYANPERMEDVLGAYRIETSFYDSDFNAVTSAAKPGRYGAVVRVIPEQGPAMTRFLTLFRLPGELRYDTFDMSGDVKLPAELGIDPAVAGEYGNFLRRQTSDMWHDRLMNDGFGAVMLAGLFEAKSLGRPARLSEDPQTADRQWWVNFKRKQYGFDKTLPSLPVMPSIMEGAAARTLREGTAAEVGMKADTAEKIDAVCQAWLKADARPFTVVVARDGVVFYEKAYGQNGGRATSMDAFGLASISKLICGTQFMMLVDRGLISLDDPIEKYLPPLGEVAGSTGKRITFRHLLTHTAGLQGHWGEAREDLEYMIGELYPTLQVGQRHEYQGVGYELGGKVMELISGKAMPTLSKQLLIEPLGLEHSDMMYMAWGCEVSAMDLAKIGQMHLNNGAYGRYRFMSEQTMAALRPQVLKATLGPETKMVWGIGCEPRAEEGGANAPPQDRVPGLSATTYGHGSATGCIIRIDPEHQIVAVMVRPGTNWGEHEKWVSRFVSAIRDGIEPAKTTAAE